MGSLNNTGDGERIVLAAGGVATLHEKRHYAIFSENTVNAMKDSPYYQSIGGPRTDEQCRALDANSDPIPGLYVAGVENGSLFCSPYYAVGGSCSGLSQASGRVAAKAMVEYIANA